MFLSLENTPQPSLSEWLIQTCKIHLVGWVRFKIESKPPLSTCAYLSISWFAFVILGLFGPRRLDIAGEHPRACGVPREVCNGLIPLPQEKESTSVRRIRSWKRIRLGCPLWSSRADLCWVARRPLNGVRTSVKQISCLHLSLHLVFVIFVCCLSLSAGYQ